MCFLQGCGPCNTTHAPKVGPVFMHIQVASHGLRGFKIKRTQGAAKEVMGRKSGGKLEGKKLGVV